MKHNPWFDDMPTPARPSLSDVAGTILGTAAVIAVVYVMAMMMARIAQ